MRFSEQYCAQLAPPTSCLHAHETPVTKTQRTESPEVIKQRRTMGAIAVSVCPERRGLVSCSANVTSTGRYSIKFVTFYAAGDKGRISNNALNANWMLAKDNRRVVSINQKVYMWSYTWHVQLRRCALELLCLVASTGSDATALAENNERRAD